MSKKKKISPFQKNILDEYYNNGLNSIAAYCKVKKIKEPKETQKRLNISSIVSKIRSENPTYIAKIEAKNEEEFGSMKDKLINQLEEVSLTFKTLMELALQDRLTEEEQQKYNRLRGIMSTRDLNKATELLGKLTGSFEAEKKEVSNTFTVDWGEAPKLIDIEHEELE